MASAPADGAANAEVVQLLAKALGVARTGIRIVSGESARLKRLEVPVEEQEIPRRLG